MCLVLWGVTVARGRSVWGAPFGDSRVCRSLIASRYLRLTGIAYFVVAIPVQDCLALEPGKVVSGTLPIFRPCHFFGERAQPLLVLLFCDDQLRSVSSEARSAFSLFLLSRGYFGRRDLYALVGLSTRVIFALGFTGSGCWFRESP